MHLNALQSLPQYSDKERTGFITYDSSDDKFLIKYPSTNDGRNDAIYFLKKIISGGFLDKDDAPINTDKLREGSKQSFQNFDLETENQGRFFQITFKPKLSDYMVINNLERATTKTIVSHQKSFAEDMRLESMEKAQDRTKSRSPSR